MRKEKGGEGLQVLGVENNERRGELKLIFKLFEEDCSENEEETAPKRGRCLSMCQKQAGKHNFSRTSPGGSRGGRVVCPLFRKY